MDDKTAAEVADLRDELHIQQTILASLESMNFEGVENERHEARQALKDIQQKIRKLEDGPGIDALEATSSQHQQEAFSHPSQQSNGGNHSSAQSSHRRPEVDVREVSSPWTASQRNPTASLQETSLPAAVSPPRNNDQGGYAPQTGYSTTPIYVPQPRHYSNPGSTFAMAQDASPSGFSRTPRPYHVSNTSKMSASPLPTRNIKRDFDAVDSPNGHQANKSQRTTPTPSSASRSAPVSRVPSAVIDLTDLEDDDPNDDAPPASTTHLRPGQPPAPRPVEWRRGPDGTWVKKENPQLEGMQTVQFHSHREPEGREQGRPGIKAESNDSSSPSNLGISSLHARNSQGLRNGQLQNQPSGSANANGTMPGSWPTDSDGGRHTPSQQPAGYRNPRPYGLAGDRLSSIIGMTAGNDYANGVDVYGNPLDARLRGHLSRVNSPPPEAMSEKDLEELINNINQEIEVPEDRQGYTPRALADGVNLYKHQTQALEWMTKMEKGKNKGGILADDMGLGKTISTLSLMHENRSKQTCKTNLIIGPLALIRQWEEEVERKTRPAQRFPMMRLHGVKVSIEEILRYEVVLTTYGTVQSQMTAFMKWEEEEKARVGSDNINYDDPVILKKAPLFHPTKAKFYRVILDEAHNIKNVKTKTAIACHNLQSQYRWCLTGTPMMNGVVELYSLVKFLRIKPYNGWENFRQAFGRLFGLKGDPKAQAMRRIQGLLRAIQLRRKKDSIIDGRPIIVLPPKTEEIVYAKMNDDEADFYEQLEKRSQVLFNKYLRDKSRGHAYSHILVLLLRLRQACCHPHLNLDVDDGPLTDPQMIERLKTLQEAVVKRIKEQIAEGSFECPVCYDAVVSPKFAFPCGHHSCEECLSKVIDEGRHDTDHGKGKCPVCRAEFDPAICFNLEAFRKIFMPEEVKKEKAEEEAQAAAEAQRLIEESPDRKSSRIKDDDDVDEKGNLKGFVIDDSDEDDFDNMKSAKSRGKQPVKDEDDSDSEADTSTALPVHPMFGRGRASGTGSGEEEVEESTEDVRPSMLKALRKEATKNYKAHKKYMAYLRKTWLPSGKVERCMELLASIKTEDKKTIVFSQWTLLLDLLEVSIQKEFPDIQALRYDGAMTPDARAQAASDFRGKKDCSVLLVSLRAGNAGLNLTAASRVIIMDPFWNPYVEMQAIDRTYRIGQKDEVKVYRILTERTVEDRIIELQNKKREMVEAALDEKAGKTIGRLGMDELRFLFFADRRP